MNKNSLFSKKYIAILFGISLFNASTSLGENPAPLPKSVSILVALGNHFKDFDITLAKERKYSEIDITTYPFAQVRNRFSQSDIVLVNLEGTLTTSSKKTAKNFNFKADPLEVGKILLAGIDVVSLANNHAFDFGEEGLNDTLNTLQVAGIPAFGAGKNLAEARKPAIIERNGLKNCFLGYLFLGAYKIEPSVVWATDDKAGVAGIAPSDDNLEPMQTLVRDDIQTTQKNTRCDVILTFFHWGKEATKTVLPYQMALAKTAAEAGADFVIGSHPHVPQAVYEVNNLNGEKIPVAYSLGNFMFAGNWNPKNKDALMVEAKITLDKNKRLRELSLIPIRTDNFPKSPFQPWIVDDQTAEIQKNKLDCRQNPKSSYCEGLIKVLP